MRLFTLGLFVASIISSIGSSIVPLMAARGADAAEPKPLVIVITGESNSGGTAKNADASPQELAPRPAVQILHPDPDKLRFEELRSITFATISGSSSSTRSFTASKMVWPAPSRRVNFPCATASG
jgi:hypothetical protein